MMVRELTPPECASALMTNYYTLTPEMRFTNMNMSNHKASAVKVVYNVTLTT